ncbi:YggN family protein [Shigella sp. FC1967]|uniref:hypothetical protein n=1 Tax=Shigella sp. FC1967 TaxID=1898041 RepID=UPI000B15D9BF|nr:hypothetical protein [Shigella sp. FC1967]
MNLRNIAVTLFFVAGTANASPSFDCAVMPKDDLRITPEFVEVAGSQGLMVIYPDGTLFQNEKKCHIDTTTTRISKKNIKPQ